MEPITMANDFEQITRFLNRFDDEVQGRDAMRPDPELRDQLERLARGECTDNERTRLCELLSKHPEWVGFLADSIKQMRPAGGV